MQTQSGDDQQEIVQTQSGPGADSRTNIVAIAVPSAVGALFLLAIAIAVAGVVILCIIKRQQSPQSHGFTRLSTERSLPVAV